MIVTATTSYTGKEKRKIKTRIYVRKEKKTNQFISQYRISYINSTKNELCRAERNIIGIGGMTAEDRLVAAVETIYCSGLVD